MAILREGEVVRNYTLLHQVDDNSWFCKCACEAEKIVSTQHLKYGETSRCITCANIERTMNPKLNKRHTRMYAMFKQSTLKKYMITEREYTDMRDDQKGCCPICGKTLDHITGFSACVDHDHDTGEVRGLLCGVCNRGIGLLGDNIIMLENAIKYLGGK